MPLISATDLHVTPGLRGVTLSVSAGETVAVLGPPGAGKSTLLGALAGDLLPDAGEVVRPEGAVYLPEGRPLDPGVPVGAWLRLAARLPGWDPALATALVGALSVPLHLAPERLSLAERTGLGLVLALAREAPVYLLDEPFQGLDTAARAEAQRAVGLRATPDAAVVVATADLGSLGRRPTHLALLAGGRLLGVADPAGWTSRVRGLHVRGLPDVARVLGDLALQVRPDGDGWVVIVDDPAWMAEDRLASAGAAYVGFGLGLEEAVLLRLGGRSGVS